MGEKPVYLDSSAPVELRVRDLLKRMTIEEKIAQLQSIWPSMVEGVEQPLVKLNEFLGAGIGEVTRVSGAWNVKPGKGAEKANSIQKLLLEKTRLGIPAIIHEECLTGFMAMGATAFFRRQ